VRQSCRGATVNRFIVAAMQLSGMQAMATIALWEGNR
jgi:hypothetical protein